MGEEILQGSLWLYRPAVLTELQTTAVSLGGEGCLVRGRSVELFCLRWQEHYPSISSQENHKWTHLVLSGKGCSWRLLGCHTISWWLFHPDVWGFFWCFFFLSPLGSRVGRKGGRGDKRYACVGAFFSDEHSECQHGIKVYFRRHQEWNLLCWYCAGLISIVPSWRTVKLYHPLYLYYFCYENSHG